MMNNPLIILNKIYEAICCLSNRHKDCSDPLPVSICDPILLEIESASLQGCWQEDSTGEKVSIEIVRGEDGTFIRYEVHKAGGTPTSVSSLDGYSLCPDGSLYISSC